MIDNVIAKPRHFTRANAVQLCVVFSATTGTIADGMHYSWSAPVIPILRSDKSPIEPVNKSEENLIELLYMFGGLAGVPITIFFVDRFGRKGAVLISAVGNLASWLMLAFATRIEIIYTARFLCGIVGDVDFVALPMYIAEIAEKEVRGLLCGLIYIAMLVGIVIMYSVGPFLSVLYSSVVGAGFVLIQLTTFSFMPESPYYFLMKKKRVKGERALKFLRANRDVTEELEEIETAVERQQLERGRPLDLIVDKGNRKALVIMCVLNFAQHFSSISVMLMNLHTILEDAKGIIPPQHSGIIFSVAMLISAGVTAYFIDKFGRRKLLLFSSFLTAISLISLATYFLFKEKEYNIEHYSWVPVFAVLLYAVAFKCGLGLVPIVMTGELFPTNVKALGMTTSDAVYVIFGAASLFVYHHLVKFGLHTPFYLFGGCCFATTLFVFFYVPETKGKTLEEIQFILKGTSLTGLRRVRRSETQSATGSKVVI